MLKLAMKHVSKIKTRTGYRYLYRRVVPERWRQRMGKAELSTTLGHTEAEAIKAYDKIHKYYQDKFDALKPYEAVVGKPTYNQLREALRSYNPLAKDGFRFSEHDDVENWQDGEEDARVLMVEHILENYQRNPITGEYEDIPEAEKKFLQSVTGGLSRNDYTIEDAFEDYLRIKKEEVPDKIHKQKVRYERVLRYLIESVGEKRNLVSINRQDAQRVRDDLLEKGQKPPTVSRYLDDIKAVLNLAAIENDIPYVDKFRNLNLPRYIPDNEQKLPLPDHVLAPVEVELEKREDQILSQFWTILKYTGARPSEISMLLANEVHVDTNMPYLEIKRRVGHRLKNQYSIRDLPLTKTPLAAVKARLQMALANGDNHLFEKFVGINGASNLSMQLNGVIDKYTSEKRHTVYSLRHNHEDWCRERLPENIEVRNAIHGRTYSQGETARYGSVKLEWMYAGMVKINGES